MLYGQYIIVVDCPKCTYNVFPHFCIHSVPYRAEAPGPVQNFAVMLRIQHPVDTDVGLIQISVLGMHMKDCTLTAQFFDRFNRINSLPDQMARVKIGSNHIAYSFS
ncbi:hypothetical protein D3C87_1427530 [compost metagenome]